MRNTVWISGWVMVIMTVSVSVATSVFVMITVWFFVMVVASCCVLFALFRVCPMQLACFWVELTLWS